MTDRFFTASRGASAQFALSSAGTLGAPETTGELRASGDARLGDAPQARLELMAERATVLGRVDRRLVASGQAQLELVPGEAVGGSRVRLQGQRDKPWRAGLNRHNDGQTSTGEQQWGLSFDWDSPLGLAGQRCMATLVFAAGSAIADERIERALACARELLEASELRLTAGATSPHKQVIVLRVLSPVTEPAIELLRKVWAAWRQEMWALVGTAPRLWNL